MISRTIFYKMGFSFQQKMEICKKFIKDEKDLSNEEKISVEKLLIEEVDESTKDFNFRTLRKLIAFVKYDESKAKDLFRATTEVDEDKKIYLEVVKKYDTTKIQIQMFIERTGKSRRTFFRVKKEVGVIVSQKNTFDTGTN